MSPVSLDLKVRNFLLGALSEADRDEFERKLLSDDDLFTLLVAAEDELVDECIHGTLSDRETQSFLSYLAKLPGGRERIDFARALSATLDVADPAAALPSHITPVGRSEARLRGWFRLVPACLAWSAAAVFLALTIGTSSIVTVYRSRIAELQNELDERNARVPAAALSGRQGDYLSLSPPRILLSAGLLRGQGAAPRLTLSERAPLVELKLELGVHEYERYRAVLHDAEARELFAASQLTAEVTDEQILVGFVIPVSRLTTGDYYVTVSGLDASEKLEPISRYDFRVIAE